MGELRGSDLALVTAQLGREPQTSFEVVARCPSGHPLVIRNQPVDRSGDPFPTLYWLTCPEASRVVSGLESEGWIKRLDERRSEDTGFEEALRESHVRYAAERDRLHPGSGSWGGVGGTSQGVKCLHAHYANHLAGGGDPAGEWVAEHVEPVHPEATRAPRAAAVDLGTNSIRLLVAEAGPDGLRELARDMVITRLGLGVDRTGRFDPLALERTLGVLDRYARRAHALGSERIRVGATSAVRDAADRGHLEEAVASLTGSPPEIVSGEREAELSFLGATAGLVAGRPVLVFDIGGGSTEVALGEETASKAVSVDVGSVRITERVGPADPPTGEDISGMRALAAEHLAEAERVVPAGEAATVVGCSGTPTTIQAVALGLERYDPERIHRTVITRSRAEEVVAALARMTVAERAAMPVMARGREDVVVAGGLIMLEILDRWGADSCIVSEADILDGLAAEMLGAADR